MLPLEYSFENFGFGSAIIRGLVNRSSSVAPFAGTFFDPAEIPALIEQRKKYPLDRKVLADRMRQQNAALSLSELSSLNIERLTEEKTFTVTTGHQLNLLTGPLFSVVKIAQTIQLARSFEKLYPDFHFVPVFWMATEDHDFEEINHVNLFGKKIAWVKEGQDAVVAGRLKLDEMGTFLEEISSLYQNDELREKIESIKSFYTSSATLAEATRKIINHLFGDSGLVILDGDDSELKKLFAPVLRAEVQHRVTHEAVNATNALLEKAGYHQQVHLRECNLFYIHPDGKRERMVFENGVFEFNGKKYQSEEVLQLIESDPSVFSPNALLRPAYQEILLPNLVYVGGGGEIAYWLQLRALFDKLQVSFPMLRVRDSVFVLNQKQTDELEKAKLGLPDLQQDADVLMKEIVLSESGDTLNFADAEAEILKAKSKVIEKVMKVDPGLNGLAEAEFSKMITALEKLEARLVKSEKSKHESLKNRILKLQAKLFPGAHFQEREENFLTWFMTDPEFIHQLTELVQPQAEPKIRLLIR